MQRKFVIFLIILLVFGLAAQSSFAYKAILGDTLSEIANQFLGRPVYGKKGSLSKLIALNPQVRNPNYLIVGEEVNLGIANPQSSTLPESSIASEILDNNPILYEEVKAEVEFLRKATLSFTPYYSFLNLNSIDITNNQETILSSKYSSGLILNYEQDWNKKIKSAMVIQLGVLKFSQPSIKNKSVLNEKKLLSTFKIYSEYALIKSFHIGINASYGKEFFVRSASLQSVTTDDLNILSLGTRLSYDFLVSDPFTLGTSLSYLAKFPTKNEVFTIKSGKEIGISIYMKQFLKNSSNSFSTELSLTKTNQNTNISEQTSSNLMLSVSLPFSIGSKEGDKR